MGVTDGETGGGGGVRTERRRGTDGESVRGAGR